MRTYGFYQALSYVVYHKTKRVPKPATKVKLRDVEVPADARVMTAVVAGTRNTTIASQ